MWTWLRRRWRSPINVLLYSPFGEGITLVPGLHEEQHDVLLYVADPAYQRVGDGLAWKINNPEAVVDQADVIVFTENGEGEKADEYRARGLPVWCGGTWVEKLEYDRLYGMKVFQEAGIRVPPTFEVSSLEEVHAIANGELKREKKAVIKVSGAGGAGSSFSYVADDMNVLGEQVEHWIEDGLLPGKWEGIIQKFVPGLEVSCEGWWNGESWSNVNITLERKKFLSGDVGPNVGCASNLIAMISPSSKLFKMVLEPIGPVLKKHGYIGQIDTNSIIADEDGLPYALEWTPRLGYDATPTLAYGWGYGAMLEHAMGRGPKPKGNGAIALGLRVSVPPYPLELKDEKALHEAYESCCGVPMEGLHERFIPFDAMMDEDGDEVVCAGTSGICGIVMGAGDDAQAVARQVYAGADRLRIPNKQYRAIDAFRKSSDDWSELLGGMLKL